MAPAVIQLALAAPAAADTFTVDATSDDPDASLDGSCDDGIGNCTLRAAFEESNASAAVNDEIGFDPSVFDGAAGGASIQLTAALPDLSDRVVIDGGTCGAAGGAETCAEVIGAGPSGFDGITFRPGSGGSKLIGLGLFELRIGVAIVATGRIAVLGNTIGDGHFGISVFGTPDSTVPATIGDDTREGENVIANNVGNAIRITRVDGVEVRGNRGWSNAQQFLDLASPPGPGNDTLLGAAEGLQAPEIADPSGPSSVSGSGEPNATVRVFAKVSAATGEVAELLAVTTADPAGAWSATFSAQPDGRRVMATQSVPGPLGSVQTSEPSRAPLLSAPTTTITQAPPTRVRTRKRAVRVGFAFFSAIYSATAQPRFECSLDGGLFLPCVSPQGVRVRKGTHTFQVRARDAQGRAGPVAPYSFKVVRKKKGKKGKKGKGK